MQELVTRYLNGGLTRRGILRKLGGLGFTAAAAESFLEPVDASESAARNEQVPDSSWVTGTGGELVVAQARAAGAEYLFTNPGSFEVGFFDAFLGQPDMHLIMGLHEGIVISMADGYARVSGKPGFVNVHVIAGTAQMAGQLYNASRDGTPLVITAGMNDNEAWSDDVSLAARPGYDQKEVTRQFTKISWEARQGASLPQMLRRAFKTATTAPGGPVYLAMAHYALETRGAKAQILPARRFMLPTRVRPSTDSVQQAAKMIDQAKRPVLMIGDEVWKSGAQAELLALSQKFALPVTDTTTGYRNFPVRHANYMGAFNLSSDYIKGMDLLVVVGARDFGGKLVPGASEAPDAKIIRIGLDTAQMSRVYATDLALVGDVRESLKDLMSALSKKRVADFRPNVRPLPTANIGKSPIHPDELGMALGRTMDKNAVFVSENLTGRHEGINFGFRDDEVMWVGNTGNGLGWGIGASIGAKLAAPDRQVVCSIGDGSVMYSASGFWTQVRYGIPILTVVWNNKNYQTVRHAYHNYKGKMAQSGQYVGMYLGDPDIDFVKLAESQGVKGEKVTRSADLEAALKRGMKVTKDGNPYVVEVEIARYGGGAESTWHGSYKLGAKKA